MFGHGLVYRYIKWFKVDLVGIEQKHSEIWDVDINSNYINIRDVIEI